jgi:hypothetical protein
MNKPSNRLLISLAILLVVACLCAGALSLGGIGYGLYSSIRTAATAVVAPTAAQPPSQVTSLPSVTSSPTSSVPTLTPTACPDGICPTLTPTVALPPGVEDQLLQIQSQVETLRGLKAKTQVSLTLLTQDQLREHVINDFLANYTAKDAQKDEFVMSALDLIPANYDLMTLYKQLYTEQVAGYYDPKVKQMFVVEGEAFGGNEKLTYSHEFTHVLQDQNYDLQNGLNYSDEKCKTQSEYCAAIQGLIEGDATQTEQLWLTTYATAQDKADITKAMQNTSSTVFDSAPAVIQEELYFPYRTGYEFVASLYDKGGEAAVDAAFANPPVSTEQIMHPERYPNDKPVTVNLPDLLPVLGQNWTKVDQGVMGEFDTYLLLAKSSDQSARLSDSTARTAAEGWGGDAYAIFSNSQNQPAVVFVADWDTAKDANEFSDAFTQYASDRWGKVNKDAQGISTWQKDTTFVLFSHSSQRTIWVQAPDEATARAILKALGS